VRAMRASATPSGDVRRKINCLLLRMPFGVLDAFLRPTCVFFLLLRGTVSPHPTGPALGAFFGQNPVHWTRIGIGATRPSFFAAAGTDLVALAGANGDDRKHSSFRDGAVGHGGAV